MTREEAEFKHGAANIIWGRPDLEWYRSRRTTPQPMVTEAKRFPKYVHGRVGFAALLHKIVAVKLTWYDFGDDGNFLVRINKPHMYAECACGAHFSLDGKRGASCELPAPDAVLCGRCEGIGPIRPKNRQVEGRPTKKEAKVRLGCVARGRALQ
jgi:hypothetical protein